MKVHATYTGMVPALTVASMGILYTPLFAHAADVDVDYVNQLLTVVHGFATSAIPVIIALAVLFFLWSLVMFILNSDDESARAAARARTIWGVVIIFVMVSVWGLVNLLDEFFGLDDTLQNGPEVPALPGGI